MFGWNFQLMLSRDSEDKMWSRLMFELLIWLQETTLARWTQSSGPLCLWQCLCHLAPPKDYFCENQGILWSVPIQQYRDNGVACWTVVPHSRIIFKDSAVAKPPNSIVQTSPTPTTPTLPLARSSQFSIFYFSSTCCTCPQPLLCSMPLCAVLRS